MEIPGASEAFAHRSYIGPDAVQMKRLQLSRYFRGLPPLFEAGENSPEKQSYSNIHRVCSGLANPLQVKLFHNPA